MSYFENMAFIFSKKGWEKLNDLLVDGTYCRSDAEEIIEFLDQCEQHYIKHDEHMFTYSGFNTDNYCGYDTLYQLCSDHINSNEWYYLDVDDNNDDTQDGQFYNNTFGAEIVRSVSLDYNTCGSQEKSYCEIELPDEDEEDEEEGEEEEDRDTDEEVKTASKMIPVANDCTCAHCGNSKYSIAERDNGIPCWKCGNLP